MVASEARLGHQFNGHANVMAALYGVNGKSIHPRRLNPYWAKRGVDSYTVDAIEREYRVKAARDGVLHQTITAEQVKK